MADMVSNPEVVIQAENLKVVYAGVRPGESGTVAVDDVSFTVHRGEVFGFLGPNGAGKTTTISVLTTLLELSSGCATVEGFDTLERAGEVRRRIGLVFQTSSADVQLTGRENLILQAGLYGHRPSEIAERIDKLLDQVELTAVADRLVGTYSGGMRRRLELAAGLVHEPKTIFLDEPTLGLDPQGRAGFWRYIRELRESRGITVFLTTHYLDEADQLCDRVAIIDHGKIIAIGTPNELKDSMGGDTVVVETVPDASDLVSILQAIAGVVAVSHEGHAYQVKCERGESLVPKIVMGAQAVGIELASITVHKPSLDEVFLRLTGREYREGGYAASGPSASEQDALSPPAVGPLAGGS